MSDFLEKDNILQRVWTARRLPGSNFRLQQSCSANLRARSKFDTASLKQVIANWLVNMRRTCSKLVVSNSLQAIAKTEYADKSRIRPPRQPTS
ncbi:hypothetical protein AVEN_9147-1 [Araneus ventricosus]|uniref:Uncharacterized protein n=1 Tax=Araneus ventricosus TaxID=182803 RepID=A0A4Y2L3Y9_ARAVE|nr:hypothetical protein AVEN_9147-1 [Araneus ventricosus]